MKPADQSEKGAVQIKIYALTCPLTHEIRYIGKTQQSLNDRYISHIRDQRKTHRRSWITSLEREGLKPGIVLIESFNEHEKDWQERERYWIAFYRQAGVRLLNHTDGGEGIINPDEHTRRRLGDYWRGRKRPDHVIEKQRQSMLGFRHTEESKKKMAESRRGLKLDLSDAQREALRLRALGHKASDETKKRMSDAKKGRKWSDEQRKHSLIAFKGREVNNDAVMRMAETKRQQAQDESFCKKLALQLGDFAKPAIDKTKATQILQMRMTGMTYAEIARRVCETNGTVRRVCLGIGPYRDLIDCAAST